MGSKIHLSEADRMEVYSIEKRIKISKILLVIISIVMLFLSFVI